MQVPHPRDLPDRLEATPAAQGDTPEEAAEKEAEGGAETEKPRPRGGLGPAQEEGGPSLDGLP